MAIPIPSTLGTQSGPHSLDGLFSKVQLRVLPQWEAAADTLPDRLPVAVRKTRILYPGVEALDVLLPWLLQSPPSRPGGPAHQNTVPVAYLLRQFANGAAPGHG